MTPSSVETITDLLSAVHRNGLPPTPFFLYDAEGIRRAAQSLQQAFAWCSAGFTEFFAVKATPTPAILTLLRDAGCGADCASLAELVLAERVGWRGEQVILTSNNTPLELYAHAAARQAIINVDDADHVPAVAEMTPQSPLLMLRYNPGDAAQGNGIIGAPTAAKFGMTHPQLFDAARHLYHAGRTRIGLHAMIVSNERDISRLVANARLLFTTAVALHQNVGVTPVMINLGGGIGIPYHPDDQPVDVAALGVAIRVAYEEILVTAGLGATALAMECGRYITGPSGYLITRVRNLKESFRNYAGVDANMSDLMRPALYGAYHHITVVGKEAEPDDRLYDVVGSLCENNDKFAVQRRLPHLDVGDLLVIHDAGAHGRAMGFNYNGTLRAAEYLVDAGKLALIRRRETLDDYFATLVF